IVHQMLVVRGGSAPRAPQLRAGSAPRAPTYNACIASLRGSSAPRALQHAPTLDLRGGSAPRAPRWVRSAPPDPLHVPLPPPSPPPSPSRYPGVARPRPPASDACCTINPSAHASVILQLALQLVWLGTTGACAPGT